MHDTHVLLTKPRRIDRGESSEGEDTMFEN
jgi:hypothetical protein